MARMGKYLTLCLVVILVLCSIIMVESASGQTIPKPSVPEFTITLADHSYDVAPVTTSTINPYNNQTTTTTIPGYHVQKTTIDLTIKNQPYPSSIDGNKSYLLYNVRLKGHYITEWTYAYGDAINSYGVQSDSDYTVLSFPTSYSISTHYGTNTEYLKTGDLIDFQVVAILAYGYNYSLSSGFPVYSYDYNSVAASDWSPTQTFTMPEPSSSPSPTLSQQTLPPETVSADLSLGLTLVAVAVLAVAVVFLLLYVRHLKRRLPKN